LPGLNPQPQPAVGHLDIVERQIERCELADPGEDVESLDGRLALQLEVADPLAGLVEVRFAEAERYPVPAVGHLQVVAVEVVAAGLVEHVIRGAGDLPASRSSSSPADGRP
jgi:hypothetical protein